MSRADPSASSALAPLLARAALSADSRTLPDAALEKAKVCLLDLLGCAMEAHPLPWAVQARSLAERMPGGAHVIGTAGRVSAVDAAFANAVMGHGLVREDMHAASVSHLGMVIWPVLMALAETCTDRAADGIAGSDLLAAAVAGYEVGAWVGAALVDPQVSRCFRPTGLTGPMAAAAAGARLLKLDEATATAAIALAANTSAGYNQWALTGGSEMFFEAGFAASNALSSLRLAQAGAWASPSALDGPSGLFAAFGKQPPAGGPGLFGGPPEILSVYHKPVPVCNFAQTPCQAALRIARDRQCPPQDIVAVHVRVTGAAASYPGCDSVGPFDRVLQAKMSIRFTVAAALLHGQLDEAVFAVLDRPELMRLVGATRLVVDDDLDRAFPAKQGAEVEVVMRDGSAHLVRFEDVPKATASDVRERFMAAAVRHMGARAAQRLQGFVDDLENAPDAGEVGELASARGRLAERTA